MSAPSNSTHPLQPTLTQVAVGIVHNQQGQLLFAQRPAGKPYAGWWEFPGGKLEANETLADALARELKEELGIAIHDCHAWLNQRFVYPHAHVNLQFCHVRHFSGAPQSLEGQAFSWGSVSAPPLPFLPAALPVLKVLQLPQTVHLTAAAKMGFDHWHGRLQHLASGVVIVSEPELSQPAAQQVLDACLAWKADAPAQRRVLLSSCHPAAWRGLCDGVHLLQADLLEMTVRPSLDWVSASVTHRSALEAAKALGCNFVLAQCSARTAPSGRRMQSWSALGALLERTEIAAFAMGGLREHDAPFAFAAGACGVALESWDEPT